MREYFKVEYRSIRCLKREWERFVDDCLDEVNKQYNEASSSYYNEASNDRYMEEYTEESIDEWYRDCMNSLNEWAESIKSKIKSTYWQGVRIIEEIENKVFYNDETGYKYTLNFCDGKLEREYNDGEYSIAFQGMYWDIDDVRIHFDPSSPELTDWIPVRLK